MRPIKKIEMTPDVLASPDKLLKHMMNVGFVENTTQGFAATSNVKGFEQCNVIMVDKDNTVWGKQGPQKINTDKMSIEELYELYRLATVMYRSMSAEERAKPAGKLIYACITDIASKIKHFTKQIRKYESIYKRGK